MDQNPRNWWRFLAPEGRTAFELWYVAWPSQFVVIAIALWVGLGLGEHAWDVPFTFQGDALHHLAAARSMIETGGWWSAPYAAAPFEMNFMLFPVGGMLDSIVMAGLARFTSSPAVVVNLFWLGTFFASAASASWCARRLGAGVPAAWMIGILFAFMPHTFWRNTGHLMLVTYLVPFPICLSILTLTGRLDSLLKRDRRILLCGCGLLGLNYIYTTFFSCFLLSLAILGGLLQRRGLRGVKLAAIAIGMQCVLTGASLAPAALAWSSDEVAAHNIQGPKTVAEAEIYGLRLRSLFTPNEMHPAGPLRRIGRRVRKAQFPFEGESMMNELGTVGGLGVLALLLVCFLRTAGFDRDGPWLSPAVTAGGALVLGLVLLTTVGGFGSLVNVVVGPAIRAYNRASVFIGFIAYFAAVMIAGGLWRRGSPGAGRSAILTVALPALAFLTIADQGRFGILRGAMAHSVARTAELEEFFGQVRERLPKGAKMLMLPFVDYPHSPHVGRFYSQEHLTAVLVGAEYRWSWPHLSGRAIGFSKRLQMLPTSQLAAEAAIQGYDAIWVDEFGFANGAAAAVTAQLTASTSTDPITSGNGRLHVIELGALRRTLEARLGAGEIARRAEAARNPRRIEWNVHPSSPSLRRLGGSLNADGELESGAFAGILFHGPYGALPAGRYRARWIGTGSGPTGQVGAVDVVRGHGRGLVKSAALVVVRSADAAVGEIQAVVEFELDSAASGVELRVRLDADSGVTLRAIELQELERE